MTRRVAVLWAALALAAGAGKLAGQTGGGSDLVAQGMSAYRALEYEQAVVLLKRALGAGSSLGDSARSDALAYLGASEVLRGRRDQADVAFRQALALEPRFRPDSLIFPPQVTEAFEDIRRHTAYVKVRVPRDTTIAYGTEQYVMRLYASARHDATVDITGETGRSGRRIYAGPIVDSLDVRWEGLDASGRAPLTGAVTVQVVSREQGRARTVRVPLAVRAVRRDTLPIPQRPNLAPITPGDGGPSGRAIGALGLGLLAGLGAIMLPELVSSSDNPGGSARYYIGGSLAAAGLIGFAVQQNRSSAVSARAAADRNAAGDAWTRRADSIRTENDRIRRDVRLRITSGAPAERGAEGEGR